MEFIAFVVSIILSAIFSGFEIAYITVPKGRLGFYFRGRIAVFLVDHPERVITTDLIGTNLANVTAAITFTEFVLKTGMSPARAVGIAGLTVTLALLVFGEILPKALARVHSIFIVRAFAYIVYVLYLLSFPFVRFFENFLFEVVGIKKRRTGGGEELELLIIRGEEEGLMEPKEGRLLRETLHFFENTASLIMIPRDEVFALSIDLEPEKFWEEARKCPYNRIPVYSGNLDNIVGMVHLKDIYFVLMKSISVKRIIRPVAVAYMDWTVDKVLKEMKKRGTPMAVVVDEYGGTTGVLSVDTIIDSLFQSLRVERERGLDGVILRGDTRLEFLRDRGIELGESEMETIAGFVIERLGRIPKSGEKVEAGGYIIHIVESDEKEIKRVLLEEKKR